MERSNETNNSSSSCSNSNNKKNAADNREEYEIKTEEVVNLFSSTLRSLAADAAAIRQITNMADALSECQEHQDDEYYDGTTAKDVADQLIELDDLVTGVEHKVVVLRQIINEEKNALHKFETILREEADEQESLIRGLMEALELKQRDEIEMEMNKNVNININADANANVNKEKDLIQNEDRHENDNDDYVLPVQQDNDECKLPYQPHEQEEEENDSFMSSIGSNSIHNSYRQSMAGSWDDETPTPITHKRQSVGSTGSSIRSNESGSFTRRQGLLRSRTFNSNSNNNSSSNNNNQSNTSMNSSYESSHHSRNTIKKVPTGYKNKLGFQDNEDDEPNYDNNINNELNRPCFVPVTDQELGRQPRLGPHMTRYDINEALLEIQNVVWNQSLLMDSFQSNCSTSSRKTYNNKRQSGSSHQYLPLNRRSGESTQTNSSSQNQNHKFAITEQDLRENCAFFKHGESTARSTLQLLCSLKRLKQVPNKKSQVTYVCLFGV